MKKPTVAKKPNTAAKVKAKVGKKRADPTMGRQPSRSAVTQSTVLGKPSDKSTDESSSSSDSVDEHNLGAGAAKADPSQSSVASATAAVPSAPATQPGTSPSPPQSLPSDSPLQSALVGAGLSSLTSLPPHVVVIAYAGTGKTFTQIVGVAWAFGGESLWPEVQRGIARAANAKRKREGKPLVDEATFKVVASPEQQAVWDSLALSRGQVSTITYCAFNKAIVTEFGEQWGWLVNLLKTKGITLQFATVNSLGYRSVTQAYGKVDCKDWHVENLTAKILGRDPREIKRNPQDAAMLAAVCELVGLCKLTMAGWEEKTGFDANLVDAEALDELCNHFQIELNGSRDKVYALVPEILLRCLEVNETREIDFNDQNWLPVVLDLPINKVDLLLIDEAQDLPRAKQEFAKRLGKRIVVVGDIAQAIYGFAGADVDSIPRMQTMLGNNGTPLEPLRLTETRRCGKAIVTEAQKIVPGFRAHEDNVEGLVRHQTMDKYRGEASDKDMVLCRVNAPLVGQALKMLKEGRKAVLRGRDFGGQLMKFVSKQEAFDPADLISKVEEWAANERKKEMARRNPSDAKLMALNDRCDCIRAFCADVTTVAEVLDKIDLLFAGKLCPTCKRHYKEEVETCPNFPCKTLSDPNGSSWPVGPKLVKPEGVLFSSVHRAKGLEATRVFLLVPSGAEMPHPMAKSPWQRQQELNCLYIAITRSIEELVWVK